MSLIKQQNTSWDQNATSWQHQQKQTAMMAYYNTWVSHRFHYRCSPWINGQFTRPNTTFFFGKCLPEFLYHTCETINVLHTDNWATSSIYVFSYSPVSGYWYLRLKSEPVHQLSEAHTHHMWGRYTSRDIKSILCAVCHQMYLYMVHTQHMSYADVWIKGSDCVYKIIACLLSHELCLLSTISFECLISDCVNVSTIRCPQILHNKRKTRSAYGM